MGIVREHIIFEKFTEDSDPIRDMGIGLINEINKWIENYCIRNKNYRPSDFIINNDLTIDIVKGKRLDISYPDLTILPSYIKFNHVYGNFSSHFDNLSAIRLNGPKIVDGDYNIFYKNIRKVTENDVRKYCKVEGDVIFYNS